MGDIKGHIMEVYYLFKIQIQDLFIGPGYSGNSHSDYHHQIGPRFQHSYHNSHNVNMNHDDYYDEDEDDDDEDWEEDGDDNSDDDDEEDWDGMGHNYQMKYSHSSNGPGWT